MRYSRTAALLAATALLAACGGSQPAVPQQPVEQPTPARVAPDQGADDYVDAVTAEGWSTLWDRAVPELRSTIRRDDFVAVQEACAAPPPDYFDVRHISENGDVATVTADRNGTNTTFRLAYTDGAWWWLPDDMNRWKRPPAALIADCRE